MTRMMQRMLFLQFRASFSKFRGIHAGWNESLPDTAVIEKYAHTSLQPLPYKDALDLGANASPEKLMKSAEYVRRMLPVRLAKSIQRFQALPYIVRINPHVNNVFHKFCTAFNILHNIEPIHTLDQEEQFTKALTGVFKETSDVVTRMSMGMKEIRQLPLSLNINYEYLDSFIDDFIRQRISRRVITEHHMSLHQQKDHWVGVFNMQTSPAHIARQMMGLAQDTCISLYGTCPPYTIVNDLEASLPYIPLHLEYMLLEIFKNALRATVERHQGAANMPAVVVRICAGDGVAIIVHDKGGGISQQSSKHVWSYGYTTYKPRQKEMLWHDYQAHGSGDHSKGDMFAGYGFGLPTCRVYARYLNGDVDIVSMVGHGTDVYIRLRPFDSFVL